MNYLFQVAAILIPHTFIAGIYVMNFEYISELIWNASSALGGVILMVSLCIKLYQTKKMGLMT